MAGNAAPSTGLPLLTQKNPSPDRGSGNDVQLRDVPDVVKAEGTLRRLAGFHNSHALGFNPDLLLLLFECAQRVPGIKTKLVLQNPRRSFPNPGFMPSDEECPSDLLDFLVRLIHLCPHRSPYGSVNCSEKHFRLQLSARCLICGLVSVPKKTRFCRKCGSEDLPARGRAKASPLDPTPFSWSTPRVQAIGQSRADGSRPPSLARCSGSPRRSQEPTDVLPQATKLLIQSLLRA